MRHYAPRRTTSTSVRVAVGIAAMALIGGFAGCAAVAQAETSTCAEVRPGVFTAETTRGGEVIHSRTAYAGALGEYAEVCGA